MTHLQLKKFIKYLGQIGYSIVGPVKTLVRQWPNGSRRPAGRSKQIVIKPITKFQELDLSDQLPLYSFKKYFLPSFETLFTYKKRQIKTKYALKKQALFGLSIFDLRAVLLYNMVFKNDPYYKARMKNILIIGQTKKPLSRPKYNLWQDKNEKDALKHVPFDIFLSTQQNKTRFKVFTGSLKGRQILNKYGYKKYIHIQFIKPGPQKNSSKLLKLKNKIAAYSDAKIWEELGKICIECGKCSIICPTCFCFDIKDCPALQTKQGTRQRIWTSCFYPEFSQIAGGEKFLNTTSERIYNWYYHKFVRIVDEYGISGCTGCGRCSKVCPAGININKVLGKIKTS